MNLDEILAQNNVLIKRDFSWGKIYEMLAASHLKVLLKVLAVRMRKLITARARKNKRTARMLANARKDHSIPLYDTCEIKESRRLHTGITNSFADSTKLALRKRIEPHGKQGTIDNNHELSRT